MPDHTRASTVSCVTAERDVKLRVRALLGCVSENVIPSRPRESPGASIIALVSDVSPDGCSGYGGVATHGSQVGSAAVRGLPSVSASRIAVIGRQKSRAALSFHVVMSASAADA